MCLKKDEKLKVDEKVGISISVRFGSKRTNFSGKRDMWAKESKRQAGPRLIAQGKYDF